MNNPTQFSTDSFVPHHDLLKWVEDSEIMMASNPDVHATYFWGRYTDSLMQRFAKDSRNLAFIGAHLESLKAGRRAA